LSYHLPQSSCLTRKRIRDRMS